MNSPNHDSESPIDCSIPFRLSRAVITWTLVVGGILSWAQGSKPPSQPAATQQDSLAPSTLPPVQLDSNAALHHMNQVVNWYRHTTTGIPDVGLPSDAIYQENARSLGAQVVQLAFESAKAESALIASQQKSNPANQS